MKKCSICGKEISEKEPAALFVRDNNSLAEICLKCETNMDNYLEKGSKDSYLYLKNNLKTAKPDVKEFFIKNGYMTNYEEVSYNNVKQKESNIVIEKTDIFKLLCNIFLVIASISYLFVFIFGIVLAVSQFKLVLIISGIGTLITYNFLGSLIFLFFIIAIMYMKNKYQKK